MNAPLRTYFSRGNFLRCAVFPTAKFQCWHCFDVSCIISWLLSAISKPGNYVPPHYGNFHITKLFCYFLVYKKVEAHLRLDWCKGEFRIIDMVVILTGTTLQSMNAKLSEQKFWHCYENGLMKTIQMIPHILYVSVKLTALYCGLRLILVYPNPQ